MTISSIICRSPRWAMAVCALLLIAPLTLSAREHDHSGQDRASIFSTINISEDDPAGDVACMFCTVNLNGDIHGDLAVMFGTVNSSSGRTISGDVAVLFSTLRLGDNSRIHGDLATALSHVDFAPSVIVDGDRSVVSSGLSVGIIVAPLLLIAGLIWLLVWIARRVLYPGYY